MSIITFGEIMLRLTPPEYHTIETTTTYQANYGGGEANVAISLSKFGHKTFFVSKLPKNQLGDGALRYLKSYGVNTDFVNLGESNIGIYFYEAGFGNRSSKVLYNRKSAAIRTIKKDSFDFDKIFKGARWFHFSGITLALGNNVREVLYEMLKYAKKHKVTISFDCNYRKTLWSIEEATPHYQRILQYLDVVFASPFDAVNLFNIKDSRDDVKLTNKEIMYELLKNSNLKKVFGTKRNNFSANENDLTAYCFTNNEYFETPKTRFKIYDRIGGGDAFAAGIINCMIKYPKNIEYILNFGLATSILKHTISGDAFMLSEKEVIDYLKNDEIGVNR